MCWHFESLVGQLALIASPVDVDGASTLQMGCPMWGRKEVFLGLGVMRSPLPAVCRNLKQFRFGLETGGDGGRLQVFFHLSRQSNGPVHVGANVA